MTVPNRFALADRGRPAASIASRNDWYRDFDLPVERERGLGAQDSHLHVGDLDLPLAPGKWVGFAASLDAADRAGSRRGTASAAAPTIARC